MNEKLKEYFISLDNSSKIAEIKKTVREIERLNNSVEKFKTIQLIAGKNNSGKSSNLAKQNQILSMLSYQKDLLKFYSSLL